MLAASGLILAVLVGYAALCAAQPFATCLKCAGLGRRKAGRRVKRCRRCRGKGSRLRYGRSTWNAWRRVHREGTR